MPAYGSPLFISATSLPSHTAPLIPTLSSAICKRLSLVNPSYFGVSVEMGGDRKTPEPAPNLDRRPRRQSWLKITQLWVKQDWSGSGLSIRRRTPTKVRVLNPSPD